MNSLFSFKSYRSYLEAVLSESKKRGLHTQLSKAAGCQPSYLSQVLKEKAELTPDHAANIASFLELSALETEFFLNLVSLARAGTIKLKNLILRRLSELQADHNSLTMRIQVEQKLEAMDSIYYSSWIWMAIHMAISIEKLQTIPALSQHFNLPEKKIESVLVTLESLKIVRFTPEHQWVQVKTSNYLPDSSHMTEANHQNWRQRAILDIQKNSIDSVHSTMVFTISKADAEKLRNNVLDFISNSRSLIESSATEELYCLNLDLFTS